MLVQTKARGPTPAREPVFIGPRQIFKMWLNMARILNLTYFVNSVAILSLNTRWRHPLKLPLITSCYCIRETVSNKRENNSCLATKAPASGKQSRCQPQRSEKLIASAVDFKYSGKRTIFSPKQMEGVYVWYVRNRLLSWKSTMSVGIMKQNTRVLHLTRVPSELRKWSNWQLAC